MCLVGGQALKETQLEEDEEDDDDDGMSMGSLGWQSSGEIWELK